MSHITLLPLWDLSDIVMQVSIRAANMLGQGRFMPTETQQGQKSKGMQRRTIRYGNSLVNTRHSVRFGFSQTI